MFIEKLPVTCRQVTGSNIYQRLDIVWIAFCKSALCMFWFRMIILGLTFNSESHMGSLSALNIEQYD